MSRTRRIPPVAPIALAAFTASFLIGCLPTDGTDSSSSGTSGGSSTADGGDGAVVSAAAQACLDTASAFATAAARCGGNYDAERTAFIRDLAGGDCSAVSIRNEAELRSGCIPSFGSISCNDLKEQRFVPSCAEQIIRSQ